VTPVWPPEGFKRSISGPWPKKIVHHCPNVKYLLTTQNTFVKYLLTTKDY